LGALNAEFTDQIPIGFLKKHVMFPLGIPRQAKSNDGVLSENKEPIDFIVSIYNPAMVNPLYDLVRLLKLDRFKMVLSTQAAILSAINRAYDMSRDSAEQLVQDMEEDSSSIISEIEHTADLLDDTSDAPIIKLVNHIISQAVKAKASDIHVEPYADSFKVRHRVDGILYDMLTPPKWIQSALIGRIKVMAKMNIAEKRLPQDSRIDVKIGNQDIDIRVSTIPTVFGERVVLRLLNKSGSVFDLNELGLSFDTMATLKKIMQMPHGIFLITGPTGSGKTTTLYAILSSINRSDINIITIEDPVEYQLDGINQIQVNPKIDLTFARGLRSIVRQDPDVILVGEIRDQETAEIAVQSALTGHMVFSTLHTNDAASAITRLVDIGIEPFLIASSVNAVAAQRLIRVLCDDCKRPYRPDEATLKLLGSAAAEQVRGKTLYKAVGCSKCFHTGYLGRVGIFEFMLLGHGIKKLLLESHDAFRINQEALKWGMTTLRDDGIRKVLAGVSTIEEIVRVTQ
jgi:general secretion pathway protein E